METCFISGILLAMASSLLSVRLNILRDCISAEIIYLEYDLLKPNLYLGGSSMDSTFSLLFDGRTEVIAFASLPLVR